MKRIFLTVFVLTLFVNCFAQNASMNRLKLDSLYGRKAHHVHVMDTLIFDDGTKIIGSRYEGNLDMTGEVKSNTSNVNDIIHLAMSFMDSASRTRLIQNEWRYVSDTASGLFTLDTTTFGFTKVGDSIRVDTAGYFAGILTLSLYQISCKIYICLNGVKMAQQYMGILPYSNSNTTVPFSFRCEAGDFISIRILDTYEATYQVVFINGYFYIRKEHN